MLGALGVFSQHKLCSLATPLPFFVSCGPRANVSVCVEGGAGKRKKSHANKTIWSRIRYRSIKLRAFDKENEDGVECFYVFFCSMVGGEGSGVYLAFFFFFF